jgi:hypothetical protein
MVYSIVCRWLDDYLADEELELSDAWDFMEWVEESEVLEVFQDCVLKTLKQERSRKDAEMILYSLLWEYYLLQRDLSNSRIEADESVAPRLQSAPSVKREAGQWFIEKRNLVLADEFYLMLEAKNVRKRLVKSKVSKRITDRDDAAVATGSLNPQAWAYKYRPVIQSIYEKHIAGALGRTGGRYRHPTLTRLAAEPDGIVVSGSRAGRLLLAAAPVSRIMENELIPDPHYIELQVAMEVCSVAAADFCECYISSGTTWKLGTAVAAGVGVGAVAVVGLPDAVETWRYEYSPLYDNTVEGRALAEAWSPHVRAITDTDADADADAAVTAVATEQLLEKHLWEIEKIQIITVRRNPRWWAAVGLPAFVDFWKHVDAVRNDPMFLSPASLDEGAAGGADRQSPVGPMFVD